MKMKIVIAAVSLVFANASVHAAEKMECCKEGKCTCCAEKKEDKDPHKDMKH